MPTKPPAAQASTIPVHCAYAELVDVVQLIPNPRNPNRHPDSQIALLAKIIRHQGWRSPIVVSRRSGFVVAGHGRLQAAGLLQVEQVPVDYQEFQSDFDEIAHMLADNRLVELSELDKDGLKDLLLELDSGPDEMFDIELTGFDMKQLEEMATAEVPKVKTCPKCGAEI